MRKKTVLILSWLLGCFLLAVVGACSGDDDLSDNEDHQQTDVVKLRLLTITETENDVASQAGATRAILEENDGLSASWEAGDRLTYCNLSRTNAMNDNIYSGTLTASSTARFSQFKGNVTCIRGDYLAVVYPATTFVTNDSYSISLSGQDGTLSTLASTFHYVYGKAHVESVTDETANATVMMKSLLTVCKFSFKDKATNADIPISTLAISYGGSGSDQNSYPQSATVAISYLKESSEVHATGVAGSAPLIVNASGQTNVYIALLPTSGQRTYNFTVTTPNGTTYTGSAKATLTEGELVVATGLKLTKLR